MASSRRKGDLLPTDIPQDDVLLLDARQRLAAFTDDSPDLESCVIFAVLANGRGKMWWFGHAPTELEEAGGIELVRCLNRVLRRETRHAWLVGLTGYRAEVGFYDQMAMIPVDSDGDKTFWIDTDEPPMVWATNDPLDYASQCHEAWKLYKEHLELAGVRPEHMRQRARMVQRDPRIDPVMVPALVNRRTGRARRASLVAYRRAG